MYICMFIHTCVYRHMPHLRDYPGPTRRVRALTCARTHTHMHIHAHAHAHTYVYLYTYMYNYTCARTHTHMPTHTPTCISIYIYIPLHVLHVHGYTIWFIYTLQIWMTQDRRNERGGAHYARAWAQNTKTHAGQCRYLSQWIHAGCQEVYIYTCMYTYVNIHVNIQIHMWCPLVYFIVVCIFCYTAHFHTNTCSAREYAHYVTADMWILNLTYTFVYLYMCIHTYTHIYLYINIFTCIYTTQFAHTTHSDIHALCILHWSTYTYNRLYATPECRPMARAYPAHQMQRPHSQRGCSCPFEARTRGASACRRRRWWVRKRVFLRGLLSNMQVSVHIL